MKRSDVVTVAISGDKPRPAVVVQADDLLESGTILVCLFTSDVTQTARHRLLLEPNGRNGLREPFLIMTENVRAVAASKIGDVIGSLSVPEMRRLDRQIAFVLGLAD